MAAPSAALTIWSLSTLLFDDYTSVLELTVELTYRLGRRHAFGSPSLVLLRVSAAYLATLVRVGFNKKAYQPSVKAIMDKYYEMFRGKTDASDENEEECAPSATAGSSSATAGSG